MKRKTLAHASLVSALALTGAAAHADSVFPVHNEAALARSFALPELGQTEVLGLGRTELRVAVDWTNEFVSRQTSYETLLLDGETQRYSLYYRVSPLTGFDFGVQLPLLVTGGGVLDSLIHSWHSLWGLPDAGRAEAPKNRYLYRYQRGGQLVLDQSDSQTALGDVQLYAGWQAYPGLAARAMVKLPTGDSAKLTGGNTGGALWLDYDPLRGVRRWFGFVSAGVSMNAKSDVLPDQQHQFLAFGGAGVGFRIWQPFAVMAQFYASSPMYDDSQTTALRRMAMQGAFGVRYDITHCTQVNFGFQEDLVTDSSPDFSIHLDVAFR